MSSLDVDSLFTNIAPDKTIDTCIGGLYNNNESTLKVPKNFFCNLLNVAIKELFVCLTINSTIKLMLWRWGL